MKVAIINRETDATIYVVDVNVGGINYQPVLEEAFSEAWKCACEDGQVPPERKDDYRFAVVSA
jgi:hypothetical protein